EAIGYLLRALRWLPPTTKNEKPRNCLVGNPSPCALNCLVLSGFGCRFQRASPGLRTYFRSFGIGRRRMSMRSLTALSARRASFFGGELVRLPFLVCSLSTFPARLPRLLRSELVCRSFLMRGPASLAGDFPLLLAIHPGKSTLAFLRHDHVPFRETDPKL